jgi:hypothetical protein
MQEVDLWSGKSINSGYTRPHRHFPNLIIDPRTFDPLMMIAQIIGHFQAACDKET